MMSAPKVSVYIPSHNYGKFLEEAIESVLRQTVDDWELILIDDNSTDNTEKIMRLYKTDERIKLVKTDGIGLPAVCNLALKHASGEYIIRLDGDDIFDENILLVLGNYLDKHAECAMVFSDFFYVDEQGTIFSHERREQVFKRDNILDTPANGACCLIRTQVLRELGGYREDLGTQDGYDLWNKLLGNFKMANVNLPLFYYRRHTDNLTNSVNRIASARRQIKIDTIMSRIGMFKPISVIIPCREKYDFCPNLWARKLNGKRLLELNIEKCLASKLIQNIVVACDNPRVTETLAQYKDSRVRFFQRDPKSTIRSVSLSQTLEEVVKVIDPMGTGVSLVSYLQAPFVQLETLEEAIGTMIVNNADSAFGAVELKDPLYRRVSFGLIPINQPRGIQTDFETVYREANISMAVKNSNLKTGSVKGRFRVNFSVNPEECFYIDSDRNLKIAHIMSMEK
jgi:glycosyltransferase involved in cell wall biosynthesis